MTNSNDEELNDDEEELKRDKLIYEMFLNVFNVELDRIHDLDNKSGKLITFSGVIISILGIFGGYVLTQIKIDWSSYILFVISLITILISILYSIQAFKIRNWAIAPDNKTLLEYGKNDEIQENILRLVSEGLSESIDDNRDINNEKVKKIKCSYYLLIAGILVTIILILKIITWKFLYG